MAIPTLIPKDISEAEFPLLNDVVRRSVDFNGRPALRSKSGYWRSASFIIGVEVAERLTYYGINSNLVTYLTGQFGQSTTAAAANVNAWAGAAAMLPLLGAFIADSFLGRYRMIIFSSLLYILALVFLSITATLSESPDCQNAGNICSPPKLHITLFLAVLYLVAFAQGGHKPCVQAFGADQFDEEDQRECRAKSSFFNWWFFCISGCVSLGILGLNYIQDNLSWGLFFGVSCIIMCFALVLFMLGTGTYRFSKQIDEINPFVRIGRAFIELARHRQAFRGAKSFEVEHQSTLARNEAQFKYPEKSIFEDGEFRSSDDVQEAEAILRLVPIWVTCLGYAVVLAQIFTFFTKQGVTMDRHITSSFQIPAASFISFSSLIIVAFVPVYDRILVPVARAITKRPSGISMLQRIGTGLFLSLLSMVIAALVEWKRLATAAEYGLVDMPNETVPLSVWWLAPQYVLFGIADSFTTVGLQEFFYDQVSSELKSIGIALCLSIIGIGGFLSSLLISVIENVTSGDGRDSWLSDNLNRAHLDYFYWLLAGLNAFGFAAYIYFAKSYVYRRSVSS